MGNFNSKSYDINNSALQPGKSVKLKMNPKNRLLQKLNCNKVYKRKSKDKPELMKSLSLVLPNDNPEVKVNRYSSGHYETFVESVDSFNLEKNPNDELTMCTKILDTKNSECLPRDKSNNSYEILKSDHKVTQEPMPKLSRTQRLSEISINSDDLMLSTDVNLDQADDDVSKDYNANEKDDPFISSMNDIDLKMDEDGYGQSGAEDSERNDIVYFDSSRESSASLQRKIGYRGNSRRPHSFSTPLRTDIKTKNRRSSNLSTVDSVDLAWTWMSASESANIVQEISNLKLMLLKTRRLLLDDYNNDVLSNGSIANENEQNVFSEPGTPIYTNDNHKLSNTDSDNQPPKCWADMDKDALIQELEEVSRRNHSLQCQLNDKNRFIELIQDHRRRFQRPHAKTEPVMSRIARSSTFDSSIMMSTQSPTSDSACFTNTFSGDSKGIQSESKNIDSGLYQSNSSTDSCLYQN